MVRRPCAIEARLIGEQGKVEVMIVASSGFGEWYLVLLFEGVDAGES